MRRNGFLRRSSAIANVLVGSLARAAVALIVVYQRCISPLIGPRCRFYPSCSQYAKEAVLKHGIVRGVSLTALRVLRCNPWNAGGIDHVP